MKTDGWFYGEPGGEVHGPMDIQIIRAAVDAGRLSETVNVSHDAAGPWAPLRVVDKLGNRAFSAPPETIEAVLAAQPEAAPKMRSVGGFVEVFGYVALGGGILCVILTLAAWYQGSLAVFSYAAGATSGIVSGVMFLAAAEVLKRLGEISRALSHRDGRK